MVARLGRGMDSFYPRVLGKQHHAGQTTNNDGLSYVRLEECQ
jgi:hypothetical protein